MTELAIWSCKICELDRELLPEGADGPMRDAVQIAYELLTLREPAFIFSGWGAELTEAECLVAPRLGSDKTGAKPDASAFPSDSSPSAPREGRHGVAAALVEKVHAGVGRLATAEERSEAHEAVDALLALIDELADRLYASTGSLSAAEAERDATYERLQEARALLTVVYFDRTEWRTNVWFKRVEKVGAGPGDVSE